MKVRFSFICILLARRLHQILQIFGRCGNSSGGGRPSPKQSTEGDVNATYSILPLVHRFCWAPGAFACMCSRVFSKRVKAPLQARNFFVEVTG
jgi:hypothetical protein